MLLEVKVIALVQTRSKHQVQSELIANGQVVHTIRIAWLFLCVKIMDHPQV